MPVQGAVYSSEIHQLTHSEYYGMEVRTGGSFHTLFYDIDITEHFLK